MKIRTAAFVVLFIALLVLFDRAMKIDHANLCARGAMPLEKC